MRILYREQCTNSLEVIEVTYMAYDDNITDLDEDYDKYSEKKIEGLYIQSLDNDDLYVLNLNKSSCEFLIEEIYKTGRVDLTKYKVLMNPEDDEFDEVY